VAVLLFVGCESNRAELIVDARSDLVPGVEFSAVVVRIVDAESVSRVVSPDERGGDEWLRGVRVGTLAVDEDTVVEARLLQAGVVVVEARVRVTPETGAVTVPLFRTCSGVTCDPTETCARGACVDPACLLNPAAEGCGGVPVECVDAAECDLVSSPCVAPTCEAGACVYETTSCGEGAYCDPAAGCQPLPTPTLDAGVRPIDAGLSEDDAGSDAGPACPSDRIDVAPLRSISGSPPSARAHICAIAGDGALWCWGHNADGQLGVDDGCVDSCPPHRVPPPEDATRWVDVGLGYRSSCALDDLGRVWCWGHNSGNFHLGREGADSPTPQPIEGDLRVADFDYAMGHGCALTEARDEVWCWGWGGDGQLGLPGGVGVSSVPRRVEIPEDPCLPGRRWAAVDVGQGFSSCALDLHGGLWCWGAGGDGAAGNGRESCAANETPTRVLTDVAQTVGGFGFRCVLGVDGRHRCFGENRQAQLGRGDVSVEAAPCGEGCSCTAVFLDETVPLGPRFERLFASTATVCALDSTGALSCWGLSNTGQTTYRTSGDGVVPCPQGGCLTVPRAITLPIEPFENDFVEAGGSSLAMCARHVDGRILCWGDNEFGQVGPGCPSPGQCVGVEVPLE